MTDTHEYRVRKVGDGRDWKDIPVIAQLRGQPDDLVDALELALQMYVAANSPPEDWPPEGNEGVLTEQPVYRYESGAWAQLGQQVVIYQTASDDTIYFEGCESEEAAIALCESLKGVTVIVARPYISRGAEG